MEVLERQYQLSTVEARVHLATQQHYIPSSTRKYSNSFTLSAKKIKTLIHVEAADRPARRGASRPLCRQFITMTVHLAPETINVTTLPAAVLEIWLVPTEI